MTPSSSPVDIIPSSPFLKVLPIIIPAVTATVDLFLFTGCIPSYFKLSDCGSGVYCCWFNSPGQHVKVSLCKILNPKLLLVCWLAPCMAATTISVRMYVCMYKLLYVAIYLLSETLHSYLAHCIKLNIDQSTLMIDCWMA